MKKTITVNLGGVIFNIEEDAYRALDEYLNSIRTYFASTGEKTSGDEIIEDIENRSAEKFAHKKIISILDVEDLIKSMGTVKDITGKEESVDSTESPKEESEKSEKSKSGTKRLFRDTENSMIAGVCSGLALYFGIDPTILRVIFAVSLFFGGAGVIIYIILWIVIPEAKTISEKMEMHGEDITLSGFKDKVEKKIESINHGRIQSAVRSISKAIGKIIGKIFPIIFGFIGIVLIVASALAIVATIISIVAVLSNANSLFLDFPIREYFQGGPLAITLVALAVAVIIPLTFLMSLGSTFLRRKSSFGMTKFLISLFIWILALSTLIIMMTRIAPSFENRFYQEEGNLVTRTYDISDFTKIENNDTISLKIERGDDYKIEATGSVNDFEQRFSITKNEDTLKLKNSSRRGICILCFFHKSPISVTITMPTLQSVESDGASYTEITGFEEDKMYIETDGASRLKMISNIKNLTANLDGASSVTLKGNSETLNIVVDGASRLLASEFISKNVAVDMDGASSSWISAIESLQVTGDGVSSLSYTGNPTVVQKLNGMSHAERFEIVVPTTNTDSSKKN